MVFVFIHVGIALSSLVATSLAAILPSSFKLRLSAVLISLTLISGTLLVILTHQPLLSSCVSGLVYLSIAMTGVIVSYRRLSGIKQTED